MAFGYFQFTGHLDSLNGAPASGVVRIEGLPNVLIDTAGDKIVVGPKTVVLDQLGNFSISLPVDTSYNGGLRNGYRVTPDLKGLANIAPTEFYAPAVNATLDYSDVIHINVVSLTPTGVSQADFDAYKATAGSGGGTGQATRTGSKPVGQGELLFNVKDAPYNAVGNGTTDDTVAIQAASDAANAAGGGIVYFPPGTYLVAGGAASTTGIIIPANNVTYAGAGMKVSTLKVDAATTRTRLFGASSRTGITFRDLGMDAGGSTACLSGVYASTTGTTKNLRVQRCFIKDFMPANGSITNGGVYTWTSDGVTVEDSEFSGCGRAINIGSPLGFVTLERNRIYAPILSNIMYTGIRVAGSTGDGTIEAKVVIKGNYVYGADRDPSNIGTEGHGISVYRVRDSEIAYNHCYYNGRGIIASYLCFGTTITGNHCVGSYDSGIRVEPEITTFNNDVGAGALRGVTLIGNTCRHGAPRSDKLVGGGNYGIGLEVSYAAGSIAQGNLCHDNTHAGIHVDSDRVVVSGNICYNNGKGAATANALNGIYMNAGTGCTVFGNQCFDNQATKTQQYGLSLNNGSAHLVFGNNFAGNGTAETLNVATNSRQGFFGTTPVAKPATTADATDLASVITLANALKANLQALGLKS